MDSYDNQTNTTQTPLGGTNPAPVDGSTVVSDNTTMPFVSEPVGVTATSSVPVDESSPTAPVDSVVVDPLAPVAATVDTTKTEPVMDIVTEVATKIAQSKNILIALSADPSVDEMASAIGLSLFLDRLGKRATAIYSGSTPNALEFLKPEETFETTADALQDFVIALNKEKADHLRYKLDGDYVKVFITPYKTRIAEEDLDFSYGDFNVDLVLALDVANGIDLDSALREHGRIMHDAVIINITTGKPGKFGEIEWSDTKASSVSEMIATLLYNFGGKVKIEKEEATAFLTGIVAATNRFSTAGTRPETMRLASKLMESGANQQLVAKNITPDIDNELLSLPGNQIDKVVDDDPTKLNIEHAGEEGVDESKVVETDVTEKESTLLADLKAAEESLSHAGAEATPETRSDLFKIDGGNMTSAEAEAKADGTPIIPSAPEGVADTTVQESSDVVEPTMEAPVETAPSVPLGPGEHPEKVIEPSADFSLDSENKDVGKYGEMLEAALSEAGGATADDVNAPIVSPADETVANSVPTPSVGIDTTVNPAFANSPVVPSAPEINGVPEMNYMPMPGEEVLPPPPAPPIDVNNAMPGAMPGAMPAPVGRGVEVPSMPGVVTQPVMTDQVYIPQASDPGAFKIPGM